MGRNKLCPYKSGKIEMKREQCLLCETVQYSLEDHMLILNSAAEPFVRQLVERFASSSAGGLVTLAEDNVALAHELLSLANHAHTIQHVAFHDYRERERAIPATVDVAVMNLLYQPNNSWMHYGLQMALHALKVGGRLYVVGAKDRGILTIAKRIEQLFGAVKTLEISKGQRVLLAHKSTAVQATAENTTLRVFADNKLDEGTRLLLDALEVQTTDEALDIGCGAGLIGLHIARLASKGHVTMVDVSLAAVAASRQAVAESKLTNIQVAPSDGAQAVLTQRFDLVVTNPPFHQGGIQTTAIAERFIREAAQVLRPQGRFYLVANRFLKYEPVLRACFQDVEEVGGDTRYKVLRATRPQTKAQRSTFPGIS
jgi:16S rRNA (guanine1207-N2)-methyltransferase